MRALAKFAGFERKLCSTRTSCVKIETEMFFTPGSPERTSVMYATHEEQCTLPTKNMLVRQRASDATGDEAGRGLVSVAMVISGNFQRKMYAQLRRPERKATAQAGYGQASPDGQCQVGKCKTSQPGSLFTNAVPTDLVQVVCPVTDDESMQYERKEHVR